MKWIIGILALLLLSRRQAPASSAPGGMTPIESLSGAEGFAIDAETGARVMVADPLPVTVTGNIRPATTFGIDFEDEAFINVPAIDPSLTKIVPTQPQFLGLPIQNPDTIPGAWPGLQSGVIVDTAPRVDFTQSPANPQPGLGEMYAKPLPAVLSQVATATDVPTGNTFSEWIGDTLIYFAEYRRADGTTYKVQFNPFGTSLDAPQQVATTPMGQVQNQNAIANPYTGRVEVGNNV